MSSELITSYLKEYKNKSFWGFLLLTRDAIVPTTPLTSRWYDLDKTWCDRFLSEARKLGEDLKEKVNRERQRNNLEEYWNDIINECKIEFKKRELQLLACSPLPPISKSEKCKSTSQIENQNLIITSQKNTNILQSSVCLELPVISRPKGSSQLSTSTIEIHSDKENSTGSKVPNQVQNIISSETDLDNITSTTSNLSEIEQSSESAPSICTEPKSLEDKEINEFLDSVYKEKLYKRYKKETGLDPWLNSETSGSSQIKKDAGNYMSHDGIIKISKFPEEKKAKYPICKEVHTRYCIWDDWSCLDKNDHYYLNCSFHIDQKKVITAVQSLSNKTQSLIPRTNPNKIYQYAIKYKIDPEKFSVITEAEKKRWTMDCFCSDLEKDICYYQGEIKRKEDPKKYHKFLTDRDRLVGKELLCCGILKSGLNPESQNWNISLKTEISVIHSDVKLKVQSAKNL
ncbi:10679_t:CDS:2 [Diversispora eburnea]|uniref:10679_t:CDS:1 n=1 Tax=Diversispora eburnea TaxID=1213867 RepID=A0A9N9CAF7_9GLOM|nr:10679_t:CDS:2 [Diversispora eburnea]